MNNQPTRRAQRILLAAVFVICLGGAFVAGTFTGILVRPANAQAAQEPQQFGIFWEVWDLVNKNFVDQDKIDPQKMTYGAIQGMLATLGDNNHTVFFSPEEAKQQAEAMQGSFEGIGAYVEDRDGFVRIVAPIHGSPAEKAGILRGDIILKVDDEDVTGLTSQEVVTKIRGPAGTDVKLTVLHANGKQPVDIAITRGKIETESVTWTRIPETDFAYLQITQFAEDTGNRMEEALKEINAASAEKPIKGILLDLRNNPGGYLAEALRVNSEFLEPGKVILYERDAKGQMKTWRAVGEGLARDIPVVALINEGTASAGEITAGALQENDRAKLVGQPTTGTGTVLQPFTLSDGSVVRIGVTNWLTPKQNLIKNKGITPDIAVQQQDLTQPLMATYTIEGKSLSDVLSQGDQQFNLGLLNLRLMTAE